MKRLIVAVSVCSLLIAVGTSCKKKTEQKPPQEQIEAPAPEPEKIAKLDSISVVDLIGETGSSWHWGSGWLDLATPTDFMKGDRLRLKIGGTATKILVRLLPKGISPDLPQGIIGGVITVPESRIVEVSLDTDHKEIIQISVHGGPNPWGMYPLGGSNGPATLAAAELCRHNR